MIIKLKPESQESTIKRLTKTIDDYLDSIAHAYRYDSIHTMVTYATSDHPTFGPEGRAAVKFRDAVYSYGLNKLHACTKENPEPVPTEVELVSSLPKFQDFL